MKTGNKELDDFMIDSIIQLRINMVELTKVGYYCEDFKTKYIQNFSKFYTTETTLKTILDEDDDIKNNDCNEFDTVLTDECKQIVIDKSNELLISFLNGEQSLLQVLNNPKNIVKSS
ncbi:Hypothetical protein SRAE_X000173600 [Strongyloides ratti]|uniref:Meis_PKNOX_N domain-containing protein n=1 Tax=Strongyloides ratti TaxID=34506 RepID=A0A090KVU3_STRRB|nr:Hypothetical protein SRAE_X000173600 [Strongyloides ratti]CEF59996.1 Hypothetical protein SRAE_X000173600 [Strongyloides ratti]